MNGRARARSLVAEDDGHAIGRFHAEQNLWSIRHQSVAVFRIRARIIYIFDSAHVRAVHLPAGCERPLALEELHESAAVLVDVFGRIVIKAREVERILRHRADAARACAEGVGKIVLFERRAGDGTHRAALAPVKSGAFNFLFVRDYFYWHRHYRSQSRA